MDIKLPEAFEKRMQEMLGEEYEDFFKAYEESNYHGLRINPLKYSEAASESVRGMLVERFGLRVVPWCASGFYYDEEERPGRHPFHHAGAYYIQEPSAMLVGELANPRPGMKVLDLCAAPGGKTSHLAGMMQGEGVLVANEIVPNRAKILSQNVERMGIRNCIVTNEDPDRLKLAMSSYFDLIVVDAPCSGEGMFRRDEIARTEWSPENVEMCGERGQNILDAADTMLKVGGRLVYSTCTFAPLENEKAICTFIEKHPLYHVEKIVLSPMETSSATDGWPSQGRPEWGIESSGVTGLENTFRLWPHLLHGEGHFVAVLSKGEVNSEEDILNTRNSGRDKDKNKDKKSNNLDMAIKLYKDFEKKNMKFELKGEFSLFGDNLYLLPDGAPILRGVRLERAGLQLGEIKKDRFEPAHALAMALKRDDFMNVCDIDIENGDDSQAIKYLCGESITCDTELKGWTLVLVAGFSVGWGKATAGMLKNHYPKGLRIKK